MSKEELHCLLPAGKGGKGSAALVMGYYQFSYSRAGLLCQQFASVFLC